MSQQQIARFVNPETGRLVQYGSAKWEELVQRGLISGASAPADFAYPAGTFVDRKVVAPVNPYATGSVSYSYTPKQAQANQQALQAHYEALPPYLQERAMTYSSSPRGRSTRGWALASPKRGPERRDMLDRCGRQAFLLPDQLKFPIMDVNCRLNCAGVQSAYNRARQWGYDQVAAEAQAILRQQCGKR